MPAMPACASAAASLITCAKIPICAAPRSRCSSRPNRAEHELQTQLGRAPSKEELAKKIGITEDEMMGWEQAFQANVHQSLDSVYDDFSVWFVSPENTPEENISDGQLRDVLKSALTTLPEREALVIQLYYVEELNVYEIAEVLEVTTGRVSQIKKAAIGKTAQFHAAGRWRRVDRMTDNWEQTSEISMTVQSAEMRVPSLAGGRHLLLSCRLVNIARGSCRLEVHPMHDDEAGGEHPAYPD